MQARNPSFVQRVQASFALHGAMRTHGEGGRKRVATMTATVMTVFGRDDVRH